MKQLVYFLCVLVGVTAASCISLESAKSGYDRNNLEDRVVEWMSNVEAPADGNVYVISVEQLRTYIGMQDSCLVYVWNPYCKGEYCCGPLAFEDYCKAHGLHPILVMSYIREEMIPSAGYLEHPTYFVDPVPFKSDFYPTYVSKMIRNLSGRKGEYHRFLKYERGTFSDYLPSLPSLQ